MVSLHFIDFISRGVLDNGQLYCITLWAGVYSPQLTIALATTIANYQSKVVYDTKESRSSVINTQSNLHDHSFAFIFCVPTTMQHHTVVLHCCIWKKISTAVLMRYWI
jgi:hypothetical protein